MRQENNPKELEFFRPLFYLGSFVTALIILFVVFANLNNLRKHQILYKYTLETNQYIEKNVTSLNELFTLFEENIDHCLDEFSYLSSCKFKENFKYAIDHQVTHDLKDWSSTAFLLKSSSNSFYLVRLSGDTREFYINGDQETSLRKLFAGESTEIPWDNYTYDLPGKEVIVAIKDEKGKVIGAIIRGVIEERFLSNKSD